MLNLITKSKIRKKIILLFVYNPDKEYYINEVAKIIGTSSGTTQRELEKLVFSGLLQKEKKANIAYFRIDKSNPILADLKKLIGKTIGLEYILKQELEKFSNIKFSFLFGSYVNGDFKNDSDIDLYVIGEINENDLYSVVKKTEKIIKRNINYHLSSLAEFVQNLEKSYFHKEIIKNSLLLTGNQDEFRKFAQKTS